MTQFSIGDLLAISGALITLGVQLATLAALRERVARLERGAESQGKRIGEAVTEIGKLHERTRTRRSTTGWPPSDEEGSGGT